MSEFAKWYQNQPPYSKFVITDGELIAKPKTKQSKDGKFDICGISKRVICNFDCCKGKFSYLSTDENKLATKLIVKYSDRNIVKAKGAIWSSYEKVWFVRASNKHYKELCDKF